MRIVYTLAILGLVCACSFSTSKTVSENLKGLSPEQEPVRPSLDTAKTRKKAAEALAYCKQKGLNTDFCILIDMSVHSGINRFVVWDFKKDSIEKSCLVSHGCGDYAWSSDQSKEKPEFSDQEGSHKTSLGKYRLGERGHSSFGINVKYLMHGLDSNNKNALERLIVFHSWDWVYNEEVYPKGTAEGWGCPAISDDNMRYMDKKLKGLKPSVLLWIYV